MGERSLLVEAITHCPQSVQERLNLANKGHWTHVGSVCLLVLASPGIALLVFSVERTSPACEVDHSLVDDGCAGDIWQGQPPGVRGEDKPIGSSNSLCDPALLIQRCRRLPVNLKNRSNGLLMAVC